MARRTLPFGLNLMPLLLGLLFFAASLTPSLIPRDWVTQGVLGGSVAAVGYLMGRFALMLWRQMWLPSPKGRMRRRLHLIMAVPVLIALTLALSQAGNWQNGIREAMGLPPQDRSRSALMVLVALVVFSGLLGVGAAIGWLFDRTRAKLAHYMPSRTSNIAGAVIVAVLVVVVSRDGVLDRVISGLDASYTTAQDLFDTAPPDTRPTGAASLISWDAMGQPGRDFVTGGPTRADIAAFVKAPARDPLRVYVGVANADTPQARAELALAELIRLGGFDRKLLIIAMPTGTGWLDPGSFDVIELMHRGDIASVAVQYSYLQSPLALILETQAGLAQARALIHTVHDHWRTLDPDTRPRLYIHGLSLGAWSSMYGTDIFALTDDPINGALWAGPPFPSEFWVNAMAQRTPGTPYVAPDVRDGRLIRFASHTKDVGGPAGWGAMRIVFLQYASDPIVFYEPASLWRAPEWMRAPAAPGVSPDLRFIPVVTQFQLALDMALSTTAPPGHGHSYTAADYIRPWVAVTAPQDWSPADSARLETLCRAGGQPGCRP